MTAKPLLSDQPAILGTFKAGDRVLIQVYGNLDTDSQAKIERSVIKFARCAVHIAFIDISCAVLFVLRGARLLRLTKQPDSPSLQATAAGRVANFSCGPIELQPGDRLIVRSLAHRNLSDLAHAAKVHYFERWAGEDVEVCVV